MVTIDSFVVVSFELALATPAPASSVAASQMAGSNVSAT